MDLQVALRVRTQSVTSHATTLHHTLLRLKARGFHHPRWGHKGSHRRLALLGCAGLSVLIRTAYASLPKAHQRTGTISAAISDRLHLSFSNEGGSFYPC